MVKICSKYKFNKYYRGKKIVALGAGSLFQSIIQKFDWNIIMAIDNDERKNGSCYEFMDKKIEIHDWQYLLDNVQNDWVLLITARDYEPFLFDIMESQKLLNCESFIWSKFDMFSFDDARMEFEHYPVVYKQKKKFLIPKIIHSFWFSSDPYPENIKKCIASWYKFCPDYEIKIWNLSNYCSDNMFFQEAIEKRSWVFASDYARADVVFKYGGIYLDSDVELLRNLDELLYHDAFIGFEEKTRIDPGSGFGAKPNNEIISQFRDIYKNLHFIKSDGSLNQLPCPAYYTRILKNNGLKLNGSYQLLDDIAVYPVTSFCPHSYVSNLLYIEDDTYSIHHHAGSWNTNKNPMWKKLQGEIKKRGIDYDVQDISSES